MSDLDSLQKLDNETEDAAYQRQVKIIDQITHLFSQLSPSAQADVIDILDDDEDNRDGEDDEDEEDA